MDPVWENLPTDMLKIIATAQTAKLLFISNCRYDSGTNG
jgi:hypothetical protein